MIYIDLTPRERRAKKHLSTLQFAVVTALVAGVLYMGAQAYLMYTKTQEVRAQLKATEATIASMSQHEAEAKALEREIQTITREMEVFQSLFLAQIPWHDVLSEVATQIPQNAWVSSLTASADGSILMDGAAFTYEDAAQVVVEMERSSLFVDADLLSASQEEALVSFRIALRLLGVPSEQKEVVR
ncbi:MAG: PilN domain-containing protein [Bacillota bacterium]